MSLSRNFSSNSPENPFSLTLRRSAAGLFRLALQHGVFIGLQGSTCLRALLEETFKVETSYVEKNINTIFIDGHPVDNIDTATLTPGCELALSGALPGICGITMGKNSPIAKMRCGIAYTETKEHTEEQFPLFKLKLFNFIARDLGPRAFAAGIGISADRLTRILVDTIAEDPDAISELSHEGKSLPLHDFLEQLPQHGERPCFLKITEQP
ncbi:hypothetical protein [Desulfobaculum bizertense]|uniref:Uncharacterized protein n=1 Tax=Desulfobaculum bizertense DSM 18034 TaxID=1121442 RepID=A0A1T4WBT1_9BACT|nr:hypothetical protein [Desulfobaculum bizertense]UIJ37518.1 hypothetical protein LWC08_12470 [Desulfobaculum bizertense]SKA74508.1 hypothetical protein SAMN02745702_01958 [Desulfobaculum bizertense DSM 18034]